MGVLDRSRPVGSRADLNLLGVGQARTVTRTDDDIVAEPDAHALSSRHLDRDPVGPERRRSPLGWRDDDDRGGGESVRVGDGVDDDPAIRADGNDQVVACVDGDPGLRRRHGEAGDRSVGVFVVVGDGHGDRGRPAISLGSTMSSRAMGARFGASGVTVTVSAPRADPPQPSLIS